jgi:hypothetical protein
MAIDILTALVEGTSSITTAGFNLGTARQGTKQAQQGTKQAQLALEAQRNASKNSESLAWLSLYGNKKTASQGVSKNSNLIVGAVVAVVILGVVLIIINKSK